MSCYQLGGWNSIRIAEDDWNFSFQSSIAKSLLKLEQFFFFHKKDWIRVWVEFQCQSCMCGNSYIDSHVFLHGIQMYALLWYASSLSEKLEWSIFRNLLTTSFGIVFTIGNMEMIFPICVLIKGFWTVTSLYQVFQSQFKLFWLGPHLLETFLLILRSGVVSKKVTAVVTRSLLAL